MGDFHELFEAAEEAFNNESFEEGMEIINEALNVVPQGKIGKKELMCISTTYKAHLGDLRGKVRAAKGKYKIKFANKLAEELAGAMRMATNLLARIGNQNGSETIVLVLINKMLGDYGRWLTEAVTETDKTEIKLKTASAIAYQYYLAAYTLACEELPPTEPTRLGVALNFSVFYYETVQMPEKAINLSKAAFDDAINRLDELSEESYKDSTLIMQLIRDNLSLWNGEEEENKNKSPIYSLDELASEDLSSFLNSDSVHSQEKVLKKPAMEKPAPTGPPKIIYESTSLVASGGHRIRKGPSTDTPQVASIYRHTNLVLSEVSGDWGKIHPCMYEELKTNEYFVEHDPAVDGWTALRLSSGEYWIPRVNDAAKGGGSANTALADRIKDAARRGMKPWGRSKIMIVGEGRAGKTALANSIIGRPFEETKSTLGINQMTCDIKHAALGGGDAGGGDAVAAWGEYKKPEKEFEAALAKILADEEAERKVASAAVIARVAAKAASGGDDEDEDEEDGEAKVTRGGNLDMPVLRRQGSGGRQSASKELDFGSFAVAGGEKKNGASGSGAKAVLVAKDKDKKKKMSQESFAAAAAANEKAVDNELVMKCLADKAQTESKLVMSVYDYGGQSVFNVIHHFFLTRYGIYALVFNMEWLATDDATTREECLGYLNFWLNSVVIHTLGVGGETAPIIFVGTRKDTVNDPAVHGKISSILYEEFSSNLAWPHVVENEEGEGPNGKTTLCFYPVDNKAGRADPTMQHLLRKVESVLLEARYVQEEKPLSWLRALDCLDGSKTPCMTYDEVCSVVNECGIHNEEVPSFLRFLNHMGFLMWHEEDGLRDIIILDAVSFFVQPATTIICKHVPSASDPTHHVLAIHKQCQKKMFEDWRMMTEKGIISERLARMLLSATANPNHVDTLLHLMSKFGLVVPLHNGADGAEEVIMASGNDLSEQADSNGPSSSSSALGSTQSVENVENFLIPALLAVANAETAKEWWPETGGTPMSTCYFYFTAAKDQQRAATMTCADMKSMGFLPRGLVERLISKALVWSQEASGVSDLRDLTLFQNTVVLNFGSQSFRILACPTINCIRLDVEGESPVALHEMITHMILKIISECMKSLNFFTLVPYNMTSSSCKASDDEQDSTMMFIPLARIRDMATNKSVLNLSRAGGRKLLNPEDVTELYGRWILDHSLKETYEVFISYRWGSHDSSFADRVFDAFSNFNIGANNRALTVFLDTRRLQDGRAFRTDFAKALLNSLVVMPIFSSDALRRMSDHNPAHEDNVVIEWMIAMVGYETPSCRVERMFPIAFGSRDKATGAIGNLFAEGLVEKLPNVVPTASIAQVRSLLQMNEVALPPRFQTMTVRQLCSEMKQYLCYPAWLAKKPGAMVADCAKRVVSVLKSCDLDRPAIGATTTANSTMHIAQPAALSSSVSVPSSPTKSANAAGGGGGRPMPEVLAEIKETMGIDEDGPWKVIAAVMKDMPQELQQQCDAIKGVKDKVYFVAEQLGISSE